MNPHGCVSFTLGNCHPSTQPQMATPKQTTQLGVRRSTFMRPAPSCKPALGARWRAVVVPLPLLLSRCPPPPPPLVDDRLAERPAAAIGVPAMPPPAPVRGNGVLSGKSVSDTATGCLTLSLGADCTPPHTPSGANSASSTCTHLELDVRVSNSIYLGAMAMIRAG